MKLTLERRWWLKGFAAGGWTLGRPLMARTRIKKWEAHSAALVKMGLLEPDLEFGSKNYRITDAGRAALEQNE